MADSYIIPQEEFATETVCRIPSMESEWDDVDDDFRQKALAIAEKLCREIIDEARKK